MGMPNSVRSPNLKEHLSVSFYKRQKLGQNTDRTQENDGPTSARGPASPAERYMRGADVYLPVVIITPGSS